MLSSTQIIIILLFIVLIIVYWSPIKDNFVSLGTIVDLQSKDSQDLYLNGNEIDPYVNNNYLYALNMSTRGTNRGSNMLINAEKDIPATKYDDAYCFGTDFYDNGKCGQVFISDDFKNKKNNENTIYLNQYSGDYVDFPVPDVMKPLNVTGDSIFKQ